MFLIPIAFRNICLISSYDFLTQTGCFIWKSLKYSCSKENRTKQVAVSSSYLNINRIYVSLAKYIVLTQICFHFPALRVLPTFAGVLRKKIIHIVHLRSSTYTRQFQVLYDKLFKQQNTFSMSLSALQDHAGCLENTRKACKSRAAGE